MITRVLLAAIIAGMIAGAVAAGFQIWRVTPLILAAEVYETQQDTAGAKTSSVQTSTTRQAEAWAPEDGFERTAYTLLTNLVMGVAFAFILAAAVMFSGRGITTRNGFIWGVLGFLVFTLAPTAGLAPELPGMPTAELVARQSWWGGTAIATASGIAMIALRKSIPYRTLGASLIALPHLIGAPHPQTIDSAVPAALAADFAANSLAMMALFWIILGVSLGWAMNRMFAVGESA